MGIYVIKMPDIGEGIAEVELVEWMVKEGDTVAEDQVLAEVMTEKATVEVPSPVHGTVLALGGAVAALALLTHTELLLIIVGIVYVLEAASVILQVAYFKHTGGKRIFRMTPIHHHFELGGWRETKVVAVFTAVSMLGALAGVCLAILPVLHNWR